MESPSVLRRGGCQLNVFLADVRDGVGPYLAIYLKSSHNWNPAQIGMATAASSIATVIAQTPAGALIDRLRQKRMLIVVAAVLVSIGCIGIALLPTFPVIILDGVAGGIFGVLSILMVADLTKGTGRFNLTQGMLATSVGVGASLSNLLAGFVAKNAGYNASFVMLSAIATVALAVFWFLVPETKELNAEANRKSTVFP